MDLPGDDSLRYLVSRYAQLLAAHGEGIGTPDLVEPTGEYFPDEFSATPEGVASLVRRVLHYAPVADDLHLELAFVEGGGGGSCSSGSCHTGGGEGAAILGDARETDEGYRISVVVRDVADPVLLTASLARSAGHIVLAEAGEDDARDGALAEVAAAACGFGLLLLNGACVYTKSCGGLRAHQGTHLDVAAAAVLLALFVRVTDAKPGQARAHLEATQSDAFEEALRWVDSNDAIVEALRHHPESLADGVFAIEPIKYGLSRLFGKSRTRPEDAAVPAKPRRERSADEERRIAETRALVEEALRAR